MIFIIESNIAYFSQTLSTNRTDIQVKISQIIEQANKAYEEKNYRLVHDLGVKYLSIENNTQNIKKDELKYFFFIIGESSILIRNDEMALQFLKRAIDLGYGKDREYAVLLVDPKFKQIRPKNAWKRLLNKAEANFTNSAVSAGDNPKAVLLYQIDQAERVLLVPELIRQNSLSEKDIRNGIKRDSVRRKKMRKLVDSNQLKTTRDFYAAAMVFHHSGNIQETKLANELAKKSLHLAGNNTEKCLAGWLFAASMDRRLWIEGKPQIYGTQRRPVNLSIPDAIEMTGNGKSLKGLKKILAIVASPTKITLEPINLQGATDQERIALCVPPIEQALKEIQQTN